jgi:hypothetical protein
MGFVPVTVTISVARVKAGRQKRQLTRLTNAFSKKLRHLNAACALHVEHYNFCRIHSSPRVSPKWRGDSD